MTTAKITVKYNNETEKRDIHIDYEFDPSSLGFEHEDEHEQLVERVIDPNALKDQSQSIEVSREEPGTEMRDEEPEETARERKTAPQLRQTAREK